MEIPYSFKELLEVSILIGNPVTGTPVDLATFSRWELHNRVINGVVYIELNQSDPMQVMKNLDLLEKQIRKFHPKGAALLEPDLAKELKGRLGRNSGTEIY